MLQIERQLMCSEIENQISIQIYAIIWYNLFSYDLCIQGVHV